MLSVSLSGWRCAIKHHLRQLNIEYISTMKIQYRIVFLASLAMLVAGCASNAPKVTGTEGVSNAAEALETAEVALQDTNVDSDGDSVVDADDRCADTAARTMVDSSGCEVSMGGVINGLNFTPSETSLPTNANVLLDRYVDVMKRYPDVVIGLEAHTDNRGPAAGNLELSKERVLSVVRYMATNGVNPARIKPFGYGESLPIAANATAEGRELNRRIEIKVLEGAL